MSKELLGWIQNNALAIYGALVGTIALFVNFSRLWLMINQSKRIFKVSSVQHDHAQEELNKKDGYDPHDGITLIGPLYVVSVVNTGKVDVHIDDAGVWVKTSFFKKERLQASIRTADYQYFDTIPNVGGVSIPPGSKKSFDVYIKRYQEVKMVVRAYAIDQEGRESIGKHKKNGVLFNPCNNPNKATAADAKSRAAE